MKHNYCPGRFRSDDRFRKWYVPNGQESTDYTMCEICYTKNIKGTPEEQNYYEVTDLYSCNCDSGNTFENFSITKNNIRISIFSNPYYDATDNEKDELAANEFKRVPVRLNSENKYEFVMEPFMQYMFGFEYLKDEEIKLLSLKQLTIDNIELKQFYTQELFITLFRYLQTYNSAELDSPQEIDGENEENQLSEQEPEEDQLPALELSPELSPELSEIEDDVEESPDREPNVEEFSLNPVTAPFFYRDVYVMRYAPMFYSAPFSFSENTNNYNIKIKFSDNDNMFSELINHEENQENEAESVIEFEMKLVCDESDEKIYSGTCNKLKMLTDELEYDKKDLQLYNDGESPERDEDILYRRSTTSEFLENIIEYNQNIYDNIKNDMEIYMVNRIKNDSITIDL